MSRIAKNSTKYGKREAQEASVGRFVPYTRFVDPRTLKTREGHYLQVIKLTGLPFETRDLEEIVGRKDNRATMWRALSDSRFSVYHHIIRRRESAYPAADFDNDFCAALDEAYRERLAAKNQYVNEQYLTIVRKPAGKTLGLLDRVMQNVSSKMDRKAVMERQKHEVDALTQAVRAAVDQLAPYGARVLTVEEREDGLYSEALSFLYYLVNAEVRDIRVPRMDLGYYLPQHRLSFSRLGYEMRDLAGESRSGAILSLKEYAPETAPGMLDGLLRLNSELILTQSFSFAPRSTTQRAMELQQRRLVNSAQGAKTLEQDMEEAIDELTSGLSVFGTHHLTVNVIGRNSLQVTEGINQVRTVFANLGIVCAREELATEHCFWAQLPGNQPFISRASLVSEKNFAGFGSLHNFPSGSPAGNHWGDAICILETSSLTPYYFNFHERDVGNFAVFGPTGTGKTVLLTFLMAQAQRLRPRSIYFDKDRGAEIYMRAIGGQYTIVEPGVPTGLNPLQLPDTEANRAFLREWLKCLASVGNNIPLTTRDEEIIYQAVHQNYLAAPEDRQLGNLAALFGGYTVDRAGSVENRLAKWHHSGERAWLFDNERDALSLENRAIGFDLTSILDDPVSRTPWLMYIFHRIDQLLQGERTIIMMDEGWKLLDDDAFAARIKDWEKTIRKRNGLIGFATQSVGDVFKSKVGDAILEQSPTQIFLPNVKADEETYCGKLKLSKREYQLIRTLSPESRMFLIRHGTDSVLARLDLSGMDEFVSVLSGRSESLRTMEHLRLSLGADAPHWLPTFMNQKGKSV